MTEHSKIRVHVMHTGEVFIAPALAFGGNLIQASGIFTPKKDKRWFPVSVYLIQHPKHGNILVDTGWDRSMSPKGELDKEAQIASLGTHMLYEVNQGLLPLGKAVDEQLAALGIKPEDLTVVLLTHLDCDHANGLRQVKGAPRILVSADEVKCARKHKERYREQWWDTCDLEEFEWNDSNGLFRRSYDLFGDRSIELIAIPGHSDGLFAVKVNGNDGRFVLLFSDGGYASKSWEEMIPSGIKTNKKEQIESLAWIREQSLSPLCVESLANHDPAVKPHVIEL